MRPWNSLFTEQSRMPGDRYRATFRAVLSSSTFSLSDQNVSPLLSPASLSFSFFKEIQIPKAPVYMIDITSFNKWHEESQIDPTQPMYTPEKPPRVYCDYRPFKPEFYFNLRRQFANEYAYNMQAYQQT
ncbi:unnamed protein product [Protopolystoma xenopodis]|uniref:Uncharacterized protein n=1 Tax=Protopolystoma xenopodis TaxID=117903 RepID=A0A448XK98_9PLAT|nr:unnamed protein product [Protopolystoma xenopodis]